MQYTFSLMFIYSFFFFFMYIIYTNNTNIVDMHSWSAYITSKLRTLQDQKMVVGFQLPPLYFLLTYHFLILSSPSCSTLEKLILLFPYKKQD